MTIDEEVERVWRQGAIRQVVELLVDYDISMQEIIDEYKRVKEGHDARAD